ncbi:MAG: ribonuclease Z, partial [Anaerolineae bacterium]|nr:ribonuclease Z [Anaerolineae bacterium]
ARRFGHLTAAQSARLAQEANVENLFLTHLSRRYREADIAAEASAIFSNTQVVRDFDKVTIAKKDK